MKILIIINDAPYGTEKGIKTMSSTLKNISMIYFRCLTRLMFV